MTVSDAVVRVLTRARALPVVLRYGITLAIVLALFVLRLATASWLPDGDPFLLFFVAILVSAALFDHGTGLFAVIVSALLAAIFLIPPIGEPYVDDPRAMVAIGLFVAIGATLAFVLESLHHAVAGQRLANAELQRSERRRTLLLHEFRHRTRNDLGSLAGLLHLRARAAGSEQLREGLRAAAQHAMALARVHTQLFLADIDEGAVIDARTFLQGLCTDLEVAITGEGLRPVVLQVEAESHALDSERAVQLGLVLNEAVTNAIKYAFPEARQGRIRVQFCRKGGEFVLSVTDDGIGLPPEDDLDPAPGATPQRGTGLGTRMLRALAAQLRGSFARHPGPDGRGTEAELRFPVTQPGAANA